MGMVGKVQRRTRITRLRRTSGGRNLVDVDALGACFYSVKSLFDVCSVVEDETWRDMQPGERGQSLLLSC